MGLRSVSSSKPRVGVRLAAVGVVGAEVTWAPSEQVPSEPVCGLLCALPGPCFHPPGPLRDRKEQSPLSHAHWTSDMSKKQTSFFLSTGMLELVVAAL